ncbi:aldose 1-epimerase family protein [Telmatospirillum siberiense]|uniref:Aldose epimerase n=1 Tax=Telmatospirillum siberiense TaxID=382514 RepID=A0A2N3PV01_9PROT|nr:aldose 1-epimerase family protein [Telmatospirillum siberiense]PKU24233.1 aldose epimerase [Telmatospirillum siberiense]
MRRHVDDAMTGPTVSIGKGALRARIAVKGGQLLSLVPSWGGEVLWQGEASVWPWHAPNLFPVVGAVAGDHLVHRGVRYPMEAHGFLRHCPMTLIERTDETARFLLIDGEGTRPHYPFAFRLVLSFAIAGDRLIQSFLVENPGREPLPVSLGGHPAFRWPMTPDGDRLAHRLIFAEPEAGPIRRVVRGGLGPEPFPTPVIGRVLPLDDRLFEMSAIVWDRLVSRTIWFGIPGGVGIEMRFDDFPHFGLWTRPGYPFLCLEPWQGHISPTGFDGELTDKPGIVKIAAGEKRQWTFSIRPLRHMAEE